MADSTGSDASGYSNLFGNLLNAASLIYGAHKANEPPQFYTAPETPNEAWKSDALKSLFNYSSGFADQYLRGISNLNPDYKLNTDQVGNPAFMGGVKVPTFDMSKLTMPSAGGPPSKPTAVPGGGNGGIPSGPGDVFGDPFGSIGSAAGSEGDPFHSFPDTSQNAKNATWDDIKKMGVAAFNLAMALNGAGMPFQLIYQKVSQMFGKNNPSTLPIKHNDVSAANLAPAGTRYREALPGQTYQEMVGNQFINNQNSNLMTSPGQLSPDFEGGNQGFGLPWDYTKFYAAGGGGPSDNGSAGGTGHRRGFLP